MHRRFAPPRGTSGHPDGRGFASLGENRSSGFASLGEATRTRILWRGGALALALTSFGGCGDDATCPSGTSGSPCRYTVGAGDAPTVPSWTDAGPTGESDTATPDDIDGADPSEADVVPPELDSSGSDGDDGSVGANDADPTTPNPNAAVERPRSAATSTTRRVDLALATARATRTVGMAIVAPARTRTHEHLDSPEVLAGRSGDTKDA